MSVLSDVLLWAQRVMGRSTAQPHLILEISSTATIEQAQEAFHKIARLAHPDLHRRSLSKEDLELLENAYARAAGAYQDFRAQAAQTSRIRPLGRTPAAGVPATGAPTAGAGAGASAGAAAGASGAPQLNSKGQLYYRKAELALSRGDLKGAVLNLKMAIAGDPSSAFLRTALAQVESEIAKR